MRFISLIPLLDTIKGHLYPYNFSVNKACMLLEWQFNALVPVTCKINNLPDGWQKVLPGDCDIKQNRLSSFFKKINILSQNIFIFRQALKELKRNQEETILFIEQFSLRHLIPLAFACLIEKPSLQLWLLHRYEPCHMAFGGRFHKFFYKILNKFTPISLKFLTDSDLLKEAQDPIFFNAVHVMPIPHTKTLCSKSYQNENDVITLWWPGEYINNEKGLQNIIRLVKAVSIGLTKKIKLRVSHNARQLLLGSNIDIEYLQGPLSEAEYFQQMAIADFVLLPYEGVQYKASTSGIFVESIIAGSIVLTNKDTWMASELNKFGLERLVIDWHSPSIFMTIENLISDYQVLNRLKHMRDSYMNFHSEVKFASEISRIACEKG